ncbi:MAG: hypothetical protein JSR33_01175 [Proteobacteria bacterium]|nr:hypothetical protein [Pseudomonadota bacterium]
MEENKDNGKNFEELEKIAISMVLTHSEAKNYPQSGTSVDNRCKQIIASVNNRIDEVKDYERYFRELD